MTKGGEKIPPSLNPSSEIILSKMSNAFSNATIF